jgi:predicted phage terminase large subunit-like protein
LSKTSFITSLAREELQKYKTVANPGLEESIEDYVVRMQPGYSKPLHLKPAITLMEQIYKGPAYIILSTPPRHSKSSLLAFVASRYLKAFPERNICYLSYNEDLAADKSREIQTYFIKNGGQINPNKRSPTLWQTAEGQKRGGPFGEVRATSVRGAITGRGYHLIIVDDPLRDRIEAESATIKDNIWDWWTSTAFTRAEPECSMIVTQTRWAPDDLAGRILAQGDPWWKEINLPALRTDENGVEHALWPERYNVEQLHRIRKSVGEYDWEALYQGNPRPRGGAVFKGVYTYEELPESLTIAIGIDLAYTQKTYSDYSVAVVMGLDRSTGKTYILDVKRQQCDATSFVHTLKSLKAQYNPSRIFWFRSGVEKGVVPFFKNAGIHITDVAAVGDKFTRAQQVAAAWNRGDVLMPTRAGWADKFLGEVLSFTGVGGSEHDDQVDALSAAFEPLLGRRVPRGPGQHRITAY